MKVNYRHKILVCEHTVGLLMREPNLTASQKTLLRVTYDALHEILNDIGHMVQPDTSGFANQGDHESQWPIDKNQQWLSLK